MRPILLSRHPDPGSQTTKLCAKKLELELFDAEIVQVTTSRLPRACLALAALVVALTVGGASAGTSWNLSGKWRGSSGNSMQLRQSGDTVTWLAHSADPKVWAHDFTGTI